MACSVLLKRRMLVMELLLRVSELLLVGRKLQVSEMLMLVLVWVRLGLGLGLGLVAQSGHGLQVRPIVAQRDGCLHSRRSMARRRLLLGGTIEALC